MYKQLKTIQELQVHFTNLYSSRYKIDNVNIETYKDYIKVSISCLRLKDNVLTLTFPKKLTDENSYCISLEEYNENKVFFNKYPLIIDEVLSEYLKDK